MRSRCHEGFRNIAIVIIILCFSIIFHALQVPWRLPKHCNYHYITVLFNHISCAPGTMKASETLQLSLDYCVFPSYFIRSRYHEGFRNIAIIMILLCVSIIFHALQVPWRLPKHCNYHYIIVFFHHISCAPGTMKASETWQLSLYYCVFPSYFMRSRYHEGFRNIAIIIILLAFSIMFRALQVPWRLPEHCNYN
jgi:hypothetical protein